jgi:hypothetical protein
MVQQLIDHRRVYVNIPVDLMKRVAYQAKKENEFTQEWIVKTLENALNALEADSLCVIPPFAFCGEVFDE